MHRLLAILAAYLFTAGPTLAHDQFDPDYPGSEVYADGQGAVHVKVVYFANQACWRIADAREGVPDRATDLPTDRHLYVTVTLARTDGSCELTSTPLQTMLDIPDKAGRISLDIFFLDDRGVLTRSQRHRIQREL
jgi:hypothetical protein